MRVTTATASVTATDLRSVMAGIRAGEGTVGALLRDTTLAYELNQAARKLQQVENQAGRLVQNMDTLVQHAAYWPTTFRPIFSKDRVRPIYCCATPWQRPRIQVMLSNIEQGTARFNETMEALKHSFTAAILSEAGQKAIDLLF
ncbi:MAG: hypothetical protein IPM98_21030 [Lewinellaceae bacterium]|nr:hypothetical protein [Lewinellaceae bacterium]